MTKLRWQLKDFPLEALVWITGLVALAFYDPTFNDHVSICPLANLGFDFCPGCGLGRSVSFLLHGNFVASFQTHPMGMFAVIVLPLRVFTLFRLYLRSHGKSSGNPAGVDR